MLCTYEKKASLHQQRSVLIVFLPIPSSGRAMAPPELAIDCPKQGHESNERWDMSQMKGGRVQVYLLRLLQQNPVVQKCRLVWYYGHTFLETPSVIGQLPNGVPEV